MGGELVSTDERRNGRRVDDQPPDLKGWRAIARSLGTLTNERQVRGFADKYGVPYGLGPDGRALAWSSEIAAWRRANIKRAVQGGQVVQIAARR